MITQPPRVAYFSMEVGLESGMPTYSGGLGVLAGDTIRSAVDLDVPMVAVSLLHRRGCFFQCVDAQGRQSEATIREQCVFTTHTPVPAGHDKFPETLARQVPPAAATVY